MLEKTNLLGAIVAIAFFGSAIHVFYIPTSGRAEVRSLDWLLRIPPGNPLDIFTLERSAAPPACVVLYPGWLYAGMVDSGSTTRLYLKS